MALDTQGVVYLVGAGPGDPGLLTIEGARRLGEADIVLYDYLANDALLAHAPSTAERVCLGRHGAGKLWTQQQINQRMIAEALAGKTVVRLKGGDPSIFGRLAEEVAACRAADVPLVIVPGVTTATAAGAFAGVTITDRDHASCVALVTGHERADGAGSTPQLFERLASFPGTLVVYMGVTTAPQWSRQLIDAGKPAETPVMIVRRCSLPDQQTITCTLGELPTVLAPKRIRPPLVVIIGDVARGEASDWFTARPLFGQTVLVTRPAGQGGELADRLAELGARVLLQPAIEIAPPADPAPFEEATRRLHEFDWVVFSSRNGVDALFDQLEAHGIDARAFGAAKIAAVGTGTAESLYAWGLRPDLIPARQDGDSLAAELAQGAAGKRFLLIRASRGREVLAETLRQAGAEVEQVVAYESRDVEVASDSVLAEIESGRVDWITLTSSAIARSSARLFGVAIDQADRKPRMVAISERTASASKDAGRSVDAVSVEANIDGLMQAIVLGVTPE